MLQVEGLHVHLETPDGVVKAVDGVSFSIRPGETLGIVGESGSGKSVLAHSLMKLNPEPPATYPKGDVYFEGKQILKMTKKELRNLRGNDIAMVFQDPMSSLNPVAKVGKQLVEAIRAHKKQPKKEAWHKAVELLVDVGISDPEARMHNYPHQFSGGMRQRVLIAMALASNPKLLIADEPTTALDVTIQAQVLDLLKRIQKKYGSAIMIITHDLGVVARLADHVLVMYAGKIVESGSADDIFYRTSMPYTWSLLRSIPTIQENSPQRLIPIDGQPPSLIERPPGCAFEPRCPFARESCKLIEPALESRGGDHAAACILSTAQFETEQAQLKGVLMP